MAFDNVANTTELFCGSALSPDNIITWNITLDSVLWNNGFFTPCSSYVLLPAALFILSILLRLLGCISRIGGGSGAIVGSSENALGAADEEIKAIVALKMKKIDVEYCVIDSFRLWGALMVLVAWPTLIAHGALNNVGDPDLMGDQIVGSVFLLFAIWFVIHDQVRYV